MSLFVWNLTLDLSGLGGHASSYATAGFFGTFKPHHHNKVETPLVGTNRKYHANITFT
jgi:hypothetical protein